MLEELLAKVKDIKSVCRDRLKAVTESGQELGEVFEDIENLIHDAKNLKPKK